MSLFTCPKCGFVESPCWRGACWLKGAVYCRLDELFVWEPDLAEKVKVLQIGEKLIVGSYVYRLTRSKNVYRLPKELANIYSSHGYTELPKGSREKRSLAVKHFSSYTNSPKNRQYAYKHRGGITENEPYKIGKRINS